MDENRISQVPLYYGTKLVVILKDFINFANKTN